jgi:GTP-binding protein
LIYFVDLPGYGYAKVSKEEKARWGKVIEEYLYTRKNITDIVLLVDIRHEPTADDKIMYDWIKSYNHNVTILGTKCDKISRGQYDKHKSVIKSALQLDGEDSLILFSSETKYGREQVWELFDQILGIDEPFRA